MIWLLEVVHRDFFWRDFLGLVQPLSSVLGALKTASCFTVTTRVVGAARPTEA